MHKHFNIKIYGLVQGVFFRESAKDKAMELNIRGWVHNEVDSTVYVEAEGEEKSLQEFLRWCNCGPKYARVSKVEVEEGEIDGHFSFEIK